MLKNPYVINSILELDRESGDCFVVASSSMDPVLKPGDKITVEHIDQKNIAVGQVVVFKSTKERLIVHRVVKRSGFIVITAGDSLRKFDHPIHVYDIVGTVKDLEVKKPVSKWSRTVRATKRRIRNML